MRGSFSHHPRLQGAQLEASDPAKPVWLSASAGTGKTSVLAARVFRLLLQGVAPERILCLTFTKAGASEMAERINSRLARWVMLDDGLLAGELAALGEKVDDASRTSARRLFARLLEAPGGGLRIQTIHAFCQTLLAGFPIEAGLAPGFRALDEGEAARLKRETLARLIAQGEQEGDRRLLAGLRGLSMRLGEEAAQKFLYRASGRAERLADVRADFTPLMRRALDVPADYGPDWLEAECGDCDEDALRIVADCYRRWSPNNGAKAAAAIEDWLALDPAGRAGGLAALDRAWNTAEGTRRKTGPRDECFPDLVDTLSAWCGELLALAGRAALADEIGEGLHAARRFAIAYRDAKARRGLVDFDDLIQRAASLLREGSGQGEWIRFKYDQQIDHILVDESQDTNLEQWLIVAGLAAEQFAGDGVRASGGRTIFTVGDYKQAIFSFQGTSPLNYRAARDGFLKQAAGSPSPFAQLDLGQSFRTTPAVLHVVDQVIADLGFAAFGMDAAPPRHESSRPKLFGSVTLLPPVAGDDGGDDGGDEAEAVGEGVGEEGWLPDATRELANRLARYVRDLLADPPWMSTLPGGGPLRAGHIMILLRGRGELAPLLVARLTAEGVPVAGIDRLRLQAPLVVQDLVAAARFAVQPGDDLALAGLLVSPIFGWTQEALYAVAQPRKGSLWRAIPEGETRDGLLTILNAADRVTPFAFFEQLLSGPLQARARLMARLGEAAREPLDELMSAVQAIELDGVASLQGFLDWFDRAEGDVVRDPGDAGDAVRVMTVHASKGLEAPLVILADAAKDPTKNYPEHLDWALDEITDPVQIFTPRKEERALVERLGKTYEQSRDAAMEEHWRLLYVAMTRAAERLVLAGTLSKKKLPPQSWFAGVEQTVEAMAGATRRRVGDWDDALVFAMGTEPRGQKKPVEARQSAVALPEWLRVPAPVESRPARPLAPSSLGSAPGEAPARDAAALERGRQSHRLFEVLAALPAEARLGAAARVSDDLALVGEVIAVLDRWPDLFGPDGLAEAPIAGVVDGAVIAGTVDRLIVGSESVTIVDFKTNRRPPRDAATIPEQHLRQMSAYVAVVAQAFPDRRVEAALLYTAGPVLHRLDAARLQAFRPLAVEPFDPLS